MRSCGTPSSPSAHITFCTLTDVLRPQILIMIFPSPTLSCPRKWACFIARIVDVPPERREGPDHPPSRRMPPNKMTSIEPTGFFRQHDRDAGADRIGELGSARDQLLLIRIVFERSLGHRADQDFEKLGIDAAGRAFGGRSGHGAFRIYTATL